MTLAPRSLEEIRATITSMSFASVMGLEVEEAGGDQAIVAVDLSPSVSFNDSAFAGLAVSAVADCAAGAAAMASLPANVLPLTVGIDTHISASTIGDRLWAQAVLRDQTAGELVYDAVVFVRRGAEAARRCGDAVVTLRVGKSAPRPVTPQ